MSTEATARRREMERRIPFSVWARQGFLTLTPGEVTDYDVVRAELDKVAQNGMSEEELQQIKQQVKGQIMLSLESTGARLYRLASFALHEEPFTTLDDLLGKIDGVTRKQVAEVSGEFFSPVGLFLLRLGPAE